MRKRKREREKERKRWREREKERENGRKYIIVFSWWFRFSGFLCPFGKKIVLGQLAKKYLIMFLVTFNLKKVGLVAQAFKKQLFDRQKW